MDIDREKELVERAKGDTAAFGELYELHYSPIFGYILKRTADIESARDITSEVFYKALLNLDRFHWRGISFSAWLYRIASHEIVNHVRHNGYRQTSLEEFTRQVIDPSPAIDDELINAEAELKKKDDFLALHAGIARLPVKYQEVIVLRYFENKPMKEVALILGKHEGTVKSLIHRGLKQLKDRLT
jgi:RNA polymerase sigma factor (sigma-70 family)